jgi:zinc transport system permease protein
MMDDFFIRALIAGVGLALIVGPLGCFVVWRRMAYFGDMIAHSALLGIAVSFLLETQIIIGVFSIAVLVALSLILLEKRKTLPMDSLLGIFSHATLAIGLVLVALMSWLRVDIMGYLFGDLLAVTKNDIYLIYGAGVLILSILGLIWRPLLAASVHEELAAVEGMKPQRNKMIFMFLMAGVVAVSIKLVGILLITSLLIIPAATARRFATTPVMMAILASLIGASGVVGGLFASLEFDTPSGPSIVVACLILFILSLFTIKKGHDL